MNKEPDFTDDIIKKFVEAVSLTRQSCDSADDFINKKTRELIANLNVIRCSHLNSNGDEKWITIKLLGGRSLKPVVLENNGDVQSTLYPEQCRLRGLTYGAPFYIDLEIKRSNGENSYLKDIYLGRIPVMVFSSQCHLNNPSERVKHNECPYDPGGYYIVNGSEKSLVGQKASMHNRMIVYSKNGTYAVAVKSNKNERVYVTTIKYKPNYALTCTFPRLLDEVPLMWVLIALGVTVEQIKKVFTLKELALLDPSFKSLPTDKEEAIRRITIREVYNVGATQAERLDQAFRSVMIPHVKYEHKGIFLLNMVKELMLAATGVIPPTDRDSVINQRVEMSCTLLSTLFHHLLIKLSNDVRLICQKSLSKLKRPIPDEKIKKWFAQINTITDGFQYALATGNWNTTFVNRTTRVGVAQALQRLSMGATTSQLRRISSSIDSTQKLAKPRYLHGTHWGRYCPSETPEGQPCGLETQLAVQTLVSLHTDPSVIIDTIEQYLLPTTVEHIAKGTQVYVNGDYKGNTSKPKEILKMVRKLRRSGQCAKDVSISHNLVRNVIHISTTSGRLCRPLLIVKRNKLIYNHKKHKNLPWFGLLTNGCIEYIDAEEEDTMLVSFHHNDVNKQNYTHCEISCTLINGLAAATIPFSDRNPAPRNCFQSAMGKQAQGVNVTNYQTRFDTTTNILQYGQKPLVSTRLANLYNVHDLPTGQNAVVAIMCWKGYGQEDSIIVNQSALDRGFGRADRYKTVKDTTSSNRDSIRFKKPLKPKKFGNYNKIDVDGLVPPRTLIKPRDCLIGKEIKKKSHGEMEMIGRRMSNMDVEDASTLADMEGRVDKVIKYQQRNGEDATKIRIRTQKIPTVGDKFSSRHGQKGTIGMTYTQENLPWTMDGMVPDIIVNPHALPSRMTIAHLIETLAGKATAVSGKFVDASPFSGLKIEELEKVLKEYGLQPRGNTTLYCPFTGEAIKSKIFMGPIYYQRLKHMVDYKIHARARGRRNALTGQPNEGRANGGGLRVGEMEKDSFITHGVPYVINERMCVSSDAIQTKVCAKCQSALFIRKNDICSKCETDANVKTIQVPSAANLLIQELHSMGVRVKTRVKMNDIPQ